MTLLVFVTCSGKEEARKISEKLLEKKLVACCNIVPEIKSVYRWEGKIKEGNEALLILKTRKQLREAVQKEIEKEHSYELPVIEFIEAEINKEAKEWLEKETKVK